jgi:hypothetical protein
MTIYQFFGRNYPHLLLPLCRSRLCAVACSDAANNGRRGARKKCMGERKDKATSSKWSFIETDNGFMIILAKPAVSSSFSQSPPVFVAKIAKLSEEGEVVESPHQPFELLPESNFVPRP